MPPVPDTKPLLAPPLEGVVTLPPDPVVVVPATPPVASAPPFAGNVIGFAVLLSLLQPASATKATTIVVAGVQSAYRCFMISSADLAVWVEIDLSGVHTARTRRTKHPTSTTIDTIDARRSCSRG
jgi:hypothetical protein